MRRALSSSLVVVAASLLALAAAAGPAAAHSTLVGTDPADGARVEAPPTTLTLRFNEPIGRPAVVVTAPDGTRVSGKAEAIDSQVTTPLSGAAQKGRYTVAYRVVSADGHPVSGETSFTSTSGRAVAPGKQAEASQSFVHRHRSHVVWAVLAAVAGLLLVVGPMLRRPRR